MILSFLLMPTMVFFMADDLPSASVISNLMALKVW